MSTDIIGINLLQRVRKRLIVSSVPVADAVSSEDLDSQDYDRTESRAALANTSAQEHMPERIAYPVRPAGQDSEFDSTCSPSREAQDPSESTVQSILDRRRE